MGGSSKLKTTSKSKELISIIAILVLSFLSVYLRPAVDLDELWNYAFTRGFAMGYVPYKDIDMVMMPLMYILFSIPLRISRTLAMYRFCEALGVFAISILTYKILRSSLSNVMSLFYTVAFMIVLGGGIQYNSLLYVCALGLYLLHRNESKIKNCYFYIGLLAATGIMFRQTSGSIIAIFEIIYLLVVNKPKAKKFLSFLIGAAIPCVFLLIFLLANGCFNEFWQECLFSLLTPSSTMSSPMGVFEILLTIIGFAVVIGCVVKFFKTKASIYLYKALLLVGLFTISIPIFDAGHMAFFMCFAVIVVIEEYSSKVKLESSLIKGVLLGASVVAAIFFAGFGLLTADFNADGEFKGVPFAFSLDGYKELVELNRLYEEEGYHVVVISESKIIFSAIEGTYEGPYHFCPPDPITYLESIPEGSVIMISDDYVNGNWQNPPVIPEYISENFSKVNEFNGFSYYLVD